MHIHFWWVCIVTSVPPVLGVDCNWGSQRPEKVQQHWKIAPGLLTAAHVKELRMSMFGERNQGCWQHGGKPGELVPAPVCDLQQGRLTVTFGLCGAAHARSSLFLLLCGAHICPVLSRWAWEPVFGSAQQWLPACQPLTVPYICNGCIGILALPCYKKGSPFTVFLYKIWSCLVVRTELLGSVGSPKFRSLFGPRLLLCEYML